MPRFNFRWHPRLGPFVANVTKKGWRSTSVKLGPLTFNLRTRQLTWNSPGPGSVTFGGKYRRRGGDRRG